jgi:hypothetical protein
MVAGDGADGATASALRDERRALIPLVTTIRLDRPDRPEVIA